MQQPYEKLKDLLELEVEKITKPEGKMTNSDVFSCLITDANYKIPIQDIYEECTDLIHHFRKLDEEKQELLLAFIEANYRKRKTKNDRHSSYGLKHEFEDWRLGSYITNEEFKGAMIVAGFTPYEIEELNCFFNVSMHKETFRMV